MFPALAVELVDRRGMPRRHEQVVVGVDADRVEVEVVDVPRGVGRRPVRLVHGDVVEAVPLEEHLAFLDVELLDDPFGHLTARRSPDRGEVRGHRVVDREERGAAFGDQELVEIAAVPVSAVHALELAVATVVDHAASAVGASGRALVPGEDGLAAVGLRAEVLRQLGRKRQEPDWLAAVVEDHRAEQARGCRLRREHRVVAGRCDEDEAGRSPRRRRVDRDRRRVPARLGHERRARRLGALGWGRP